MDRRKRRPKTLVNNGANVTASDEHGWTALMLALLAAHKPEPANSESLLSLDVSNSIERVRILLDAGADVNSRGHAGDTPLMMAAMSGRTDAVRMLLDRRANVAAVDNSGQTARAYALKEGYRDIVDLLDKFNQEH